MRVKAVCGRQFLVRGPAQVVANRGGWLQIDLPHADPTVAVHVAPLLTNISRSGGEKPKGQLRLDKFKSRAEFLANSQYAHKVAQFRPRP